jgi:hypothetical protein
MELISRLDITHKIKQLCGNKFGKLNTYDTLHFTHFFEESDRYVATIFKFSHSEEKIVYQCKEYTMKEFERVLDLLAFE